MLRVGNILYFNQFFYKIGALTSKPFAYKARSWELTTTYIANILFGSGEKL